MNHWNFNPETGELDLSFNRLVLKYDDKKENIEVQSILAPTVNDKRGAEVGDAFWGLRETKLNDAKDESEDLAYSDDVILAEMNRVLRKSHLNYTPTEDDVEVDKNGKSTPKPKRRKQNKKKNGNGNGSGDEQKSKTSEFSFTDLPNIHTPFRISAGGLGKLEEAVVLWARENLQILLNFEICESQIDVLELFIKYATRMKYVFVCFRYMDTRGSLELPYEDMLKASWVKMIESNYYRDFMSRQSALVRKVLNEWNDDDLYKLSEIQYWFGYMQFTIGESLTKRMCFEQDRLLELDMVDVPYFTGKLRKLYLAMYDPKHNNRLIRTDKLDIYNCKAKFFSQVILSIYVSSQYYEYLSKVGSWELVYLLKEISKEICLRPNIFYPQIMFNVERFFDNQLIFPECTDFSNLSLFNADVNEDRISFRNVIWLISDSTGMVESFLQMPMSSFSDYWNSVCKRIAVDDKFDVANHFHCCYEVLQESDRSRFLRDTYSKLLNYFEENTFRLDLLAQNVKFAEIARAGISFFKEVTGDNKLVDYTRAISSMNKGQHLRNSEFTVIPVRFSNDIKYENNKKVKLPPSVRRSIKPLFSRIKEEGKLLKLNNCYHLVEMDIILAENTVAVKCDAFVATILMQFEDRDSISKSELLENTGLMQTNFNSSIEKLTKNKILQQRQNMFILNKDLQQSDISEADALL